MSREVVPRKNYSNFFISILKFIFLSIQVLNCLEVFWLNKIRNATGNNRSEETKKEKKMTLPTYLTIKEFI